MNLNHHSVLITGGTGSFGKAFVKEILQRYPRIKRLVIFSRDELKQYEMASHYPEDQYPTLRFFIGDVRDAQRVKRAFQGIDIVVHAAALKQVPAAEYNPMECIKTNILGAENVINAALETGVQKVIALSTDKAAAPINLYGATKLCSDKLFVAANNIKGSQKISFSVVRYGNVMGSRGSVVPFFLKQKETGVLTLTNREMTRFNISLAEGVDLVIYALEKSWGGEIFVPKIPSYNVGDLAEAIGPNCEHKEIGIRPGEKLHEEMITDSDSFYSYDLGKYYVIVPQSPSWSVNDFCEEFNAKPLDKGFRYNSASNAVWLSIEDIRRLIVEQVDPNFQP